MKKVNPRRKPATQADVLKAQRKAYNDAIIYVSAMFFTIMRDKFNFGIIRLKRIWKYLDELADNVNDGNVSLPDLITTLQEECGIDFKEKF